MEVRVFTDSIPEPGRRPDAPVDLVLAPGLLAATQDELLARSDGRREALVLWAGRSSPDGRAVISHLLTPAFVSRRDHLTIPPAERHLLADWVRGEQLLIFSDLHTHPTRAFLSSADIAAPFSTRDGFYATVIPNFARGAPGEDWRLYEVLNGRWHEVPPKARIRELSL
jgi:hypothetical protein